MSITINLHANIGITHRFIVEDPRVDELKEAIQGLEDHMSKQDDAIAAFEAKSTEQLAALGVAIDNIAADEQRILDQLQNAVSDLTPENQAKLDGVVAAMTAAVQKSQALADSLPDPVVS